MSVLNNDQTLGIFSPRTRESKWIDRAGMRSHSLAIYCFIAPLCCANFRTIVTPEILIEFASNGVFLFAFNHMSFFFCHLESVVHIGIEEERTIWGMFVQQWFLLILSDERTAREIGHRRFKQHEASRQTRTLLQSCSESWISNVHAITQTTVAKESFLIQQRSSAESRDDTSCSLWTGNTCLFHLKITFAVDVI